MPWRRNCWHVVSYPHFVSLNRNTSTWRVIIDTPQLAFERDRVRKSVWRVGATLRRTKIAIDIMMIETSSSAEKEPKSSGQSQFLFIFIQVFQLVVTVTVEAVCNLSARYVPHWNRQESLSHSSFAIAGGVCHCRDCLVSDDRHLHGRKPSKKKKLRILCSTAQMGIVRCVPIELVSWRLDNFRVACCCLLFGRRHYIVLPEGTQNWLPSNNSSKLLCKTFSHSYRRVLIDFVEIWIMLLLAFNYRACTAVKLKFHCYGSSCFIAWNAHCTSQRPIWGLSECERAKKNIMKINSISATNGPRFDDLHHYGRFSWW